MTQYTHDSLPPLAILDFSQVWLVVGDCCVHLYCQVWLMVGDCHVYLFVFISLFHFGPSSCKVSLTGHYLCIHVLHLYKVFLCIPFSTYEYKQYIIFSIFVIFLCQHSL